MASTAGGCKHSRSASAIVAGAASGYHLLKIDGYSRIKGLPTGEALKSCAFTVGGYRWRIHCYPNGSKSDYSDFISLFLHLDDGQVTKQSKYASSVAAVGGNKVHQAGSIGEIGASEERFFHRAVRHHRHHRVPCGGGDGRGAKTTEGELRLRASVRSAAASGGSSPQREGRRRGVRGRRRDFRRSPVRARGAVTGLQRGAVWLDEGERRRGCRPHRRHGGSGVQGAAPLRVHRLASGDGRGGARHHGSASARRGGQVRHGEAQAHLRGHAVQVH
ncbi:hypothetical protein DAI22_10g105400 [Oryza sativa Japonica Group]|nr:hypothetical protein DAI22_10g105400 [Oryza sativa Japonica Group]